MKNPLLNSIKYEVKSKNGKQETHCAPEREQPSLYILRVSTLLRMPFVEAGFCCLKIYSIHSEAFSRQIQAKNFLQFWLTSILCIIHYLLTLGFSFKRETFEKWIRLQMIIFNSFLRRSQMPLIKQQDVYLLYRRNVKSISST